MKKEISVIIPYHNEGQSFIMTAVDQIQQTIDVEDYEIIIVDDGSSSPFDYRWIAGRDVKLIRHLTNRGVGAAFDSGCNASESDRLFLIGSDIRFIPNTWASQMITEIDKYPKAFTCSSCIGINQEKPENMDINKRRLITVVNGATIILFHDQKSNHRMSITFRGILEAQWLSALKDRNIDSKEIPCILGAFYGVSKQWYIYCDGWNLHRLWGTLEPMISLKSWLFGGSCRTAPRIETAHIFKKVGTHGTTQDILLYNKMMVATLLFPEKETKRLIDFLGTNPTVEKARKMYKDNLPIILEKKEEYSKKIVINPDDYFSRWNIDMRK